MLCPICKRPHVGCVDSRPSPATVLRKRACPDCGYRFTTVELAREDLERALGGRVYLKELIEELEK